MAIPVLLHISGEDPVRGEVEGLPTSADTTITINNPRHRDGKDLRYLLDNVVSVVFPMHRIMYIEILPSAEEEKLISYVRE